MGWGKGEGEGEGESEGTSLDVCACVYVDGCVCVDGWVELYCRHNSLPFVFQYACIPFQKPFI